MCSDTKGLLSLSFVATLSAVSLSCIKMYERYVHG